MNDDIQRDPVTKVEAFPLAGRLPKTPAETLNNLKCQDRERAAHQSQLNVAAGSKQAPACCKPLHISLFFDGTNNNEPEDKKPYQQKPYGALSNIARLYHASLGRDEDAISLKTRAEGYFSYYMPGVGTPFPVIGEADFSDDGLKYAKGGQNRINWAITCLIAAIKESCKEHLDISEAAGLVRKTATGWLQSGAEVTQSVMKPKFTELESLVAAQKNPKLLAIKLYVYGFSRGAAEARAFVWWLLPLLKRERDGKKGFFLAGLPITLEFLGLFDTVASVGVAHVAPFFAGHMSWADDTMKLPDETEYGDFIKCCRHFVAAHEQRLCFPLDSVRRIAGKVSKYPSYAREYVYPGMHSDVGGGYLLGEQGMGMDKQGMLLSQIPLHDMYAQALAVGAPLQVPDVGQRECDSTFPAWRMMAGDTLLQFQVEPDLITRFNAWLATCPNGPVEEVLATMTGQITAWRIRRFAAAPGNAVSYRQQRFFADSARNGRSEDEDAGKYAANKQARIDAANAIKKERQAAQDAAARAKAAGGQAADLPPKPGPRIYEPAMDQRQWSEAAAEFRHDYEGRILRQQHSVAQILIDTLPASTILLINGDDEVAEFNRLKTAGEAGVKTLFSPDMADVLALYDNHIHDSRAWFMYSSLGSREMWSGYFRNRMIYVDTLTNKALSPVAVAGRVIGVATLVGGVVYTVRQRNLKGIAGGLAGTLAVTSLEHVITDQITGATIPALPGADKLWAFTNDIGTVVTQQQQESVLAFHQSGMDRLNQLIAAAGGTVQGSSSTAPGVQTQAEGMLA
ncbi:T6SS phospholipase effector Tle1-like catalytic domain-containing protein [Amantichitinum ursilacus]|uniref:DUF2235 domain-containing protein n=1 Tax=Amantichitinum ursilacus TaxID=857265 RepID=A0A0N1JT48_9NEIS|nr:DUF2235 domain-containing protein [Amantichitinum ursilacus]KPC53778.1 hypothetical protein WG78_08040 [Amantichitinum ursilacus]